MGVFAWLSFISLALVWSGAQKSIPDFRHGAIIEERGEVILVDTYIYVRIKTDRTVKIPSYLYKIIFLLNDMEMNIIKIGGQKEKMYEAAIYEKLGVERRESVKRTKEKAVAIFDWFPSKKEVASRKKKISRSSCWNI